jgi:hypothetical protein
VAINTATGAITGKATAAGTFPVTITATDPSGSAGSAAIRWQVGGLIGIVDPAPAGALLGHQGDYGLARLIIPRLSIQRTAPVNPDRTHIGYGSRRTISAKLACQYR